MWFLAAVPPGETPGAFLSVLLVVSVVVGAVGVAWLRFLRRRGRR